jgi:hypothetical protein
MADRKGLLGPSAVSPKRASNGATQEKPKIEQPTMGPENIESFQRKAICCKAQKSWVICCKLDTMGPAYKSPRKSSDIKRQRIISSLTSGAITSSLKRIE